LPKACGNAMDNVLLLILTNKDKPASHIVTKGNVRWFLNVAVQSMNTKDHNTAILLRSVLNHSCIEKLNVMSKKMTTKLNRLEEEYGNFINCQSTHIKHLLEEDITSFGPGQAIPSFMTLDMYSKRNKAHRKAFVSIGKRPTSLVRLEDQLDTLMSTLRDKFRSKNPLIPLYTEDPNISPVKLYEIVNSIVPRQKRKRQK